MSDVFRRSAQSLRADGWRPTYAAAAAALLLLGGWTLWLFRGRVIVVAQSEHARLESSGAVHVVDAPVEGRVRAVHAALGQRVQSGDVLLEIDTVREALRQHEDEARVQSKRALVEQLARQLALEEESLRQTRESMDAAAREAAKRFSEADEQARSAEEEAARAGELFRRGLLPSAERNRIDSESRRRRAAADALGQASGRAVSEAKLVVASKGAAVAKLQGDLDAAQSDIRGLIISTQVSAADVDRGLVRAPVGGRVGELLDLHVGSVVKVGDRLTSIIPDGRVTIAAEYKPSVAVGRIRAGQRARFLVDAFPVIEYGAIEGVVERVAAEPKNGTVRVELRVVRVPRAIPPQHALTGIAEVEAERVSPATLLLRSAGWSVE
jgi:multidrug resistance efflux pump